MSFPTSRIVISKNGDSRIEGLEQSEQCYKLSELGKSAGKVVKDDAAEHTPVYQDVNHRRN
jgi:hypothetical protein